MKRFLFGIALLGVFVAIAFAQGRFDQTLRTLRVLNEFRSPVVTVAGSAGTMTIPDGVTFSLTGTTKQTALTAGNDGRVVHLITASTDTLVDGNNLLLAGDFNGTANDVLVLVATGANWTEVSRSAN